MSLLQVFLHLNHKSIFKIKDSNLVLDESGLSINKPITIKKGK